MPGSSERAFLKSLNSISEDNGRVSFYDVDLVKKTTPDLSVIDLIF